MVLKFIGAGAVFSACCAIGIIKSAQLGSDVKFLEGIDDALLILENEISAALTPLPLAMEKAARAEPMFGRAAEYMRGGESAYDAFTRAAGGCTGGTLATLQSFATGLWAEDCEGQLKNISLCRARIKKEILTAAEKKDKLQRVYTGFGALGGIAAVIMLV